MNKRLAKMLVEYVEASSANRIKSASVISDLQRKISAQDEQKEKLREKVSHIVQGLVDNGDVLPAFADSIANDLVSNPNKLVDMLMDKKANISLGSPADDKVQTHGDPILEFAFGI